MTFITKPTLKAAPVANDKAQDHVIEMRVVNRPRAGHRAHTKGRPSILVFLMAIMAMLVLLAGMVYLLPSLIVTTTTTRYQGFCTIPIKDLTDDPSYFDQPSYKVMPLRWSSNPDVQVFSTAGEDATDDVINGLREQFDIGDTVEKISVMDNGRHVNFIHDFEANMTGIVDSDRCFMMDLDPEMVMTPEVLVLSIEGGAKFDISRVRWSLRAALPALQHHLARALREPCAARPVYRLLKDSAGIRKRSADAPAHDYIHFAGRRVQEIDISNLAELLQREQDNKLA